MHPYLGKSRKGGIALGLLLALLPELFGMVNRGFPMPKTHSSARPCAI